MLIFATCGRMLIDSYSPVEWASNGDFAALTVALNPGRSGLVQTNSEAVNGVRLVRPKTLRRLHQPGAGPAVVTTFPEVDFAIAIMANAPLDKDGNDLK